MKRSLNALRNTWLTRRNHWLDKRIPAENRSQFDLKNTFILPSSFGWAIIAIVVFLFILGTNYQNNIVLSMSYFFSALILLSLFHSYQYFTQHELAFLPFEAEFENRDVILNCKLYSKGRYPAGEFILSSEGRSAVYPLAAKYDEEVLRLNLPPRKRGLHLSKRIKVECFYGFGLFRCWSYLQPKHMILIYPSAQKAPIRLHQTALEDDNTLSSQTKVTQADNLQGIRNFVKTDPIHHVSWKHVAKGQGLLTKDFSQHAGASGWIKLSDLMHEGLESALRMLSYQVQTLSQEQIEFGLDLGSTKLLPQNTHEHMQKCLYQLATYGQKNTFNRRESDA